VTLRVHQVPQPPVLLLLFILLLLPAFITILPATNLFHYNISMCSLHRAAHTENTLYPLLFACSNLNCRAASQQQCSKCNDD
jgi:hypothetical protein